MTRINRKSIVYTAVVLVICCVSSHAWISPQSTSNPRRFHSLTATKTEEASTATFRETHHSALSYSFEELTKVLGGKGRAQSCWDCFRLGVDPIWFFGTTNDDAREDVGLLEEGTQEGWTRLQLQESMSGRRAVDGLGMKMVGFLNQRFGFIENEIATLSEITTSPDGTTKLLLQLVKDGLEVEAVIIPWSDRGKSTLCISSQVGCRQACTFCSTGRMGKLRSLSADEILAQMHWAKKACRIRSIYPIDNIVFMGMGEPADNCGPVVRAAQILVDPNLYQLAPRRVTISTVAPSPESFEALGESNVVLAWSVHASRDDLRRELVPTTQHSMEELRGGLIRTLQGRSKRLRTTMLEMTILDQINDSTEDALHLVDFCQPFLEQVKGLKLVVNLIPWNDIGATSGPAAAYRKPSMSRILAFQKVLVDHDILCYVRTTRGDEENAACGMLATKKRANEV
jgi:23S rRNA (adenine2503-C2)-methyltransferase